MNERDRPVIEEFRANEGRVGGHWEGRDLLLLTTTGRRSGRPHTTPVVYTRDGDRLLVYASKGGAPSHPDWYRNLVADPDVVVEVGPDRYEAVRPHSRARSETASSQPTPPAGPPSPGTRPGPGGSSRWSPSAAADTPASEAATRS